MLKKKEKSHIFDVLCFIFSRKVKTQLKCKKKICAVYGEGAVTDRTCQKWFSCQSRFDARYWMLGAGALGRPRGMEWGGRREEGS